MRKMSLAIRRFCRCDEAATAVEYAIIIGLVAISIAAVLIALREEIRAVIEAAIGVLGLREP